MLNLQLKLGAYGQNAQGFEKDYKGQPEPPARGQGSVLPEIKNFGVGGEYVSNDQRLQGTNKEGLGISRYEFIRNQQRIEYPSILFPQAPLAYAKEQIKQIAKMLTKDYAQIRNSYLPDNKKQEMITSSLSKVRGFPAPLVKIADMLVEARLSEYPLEALIVDNDIDYDKEIEEVFSTMEPEQYADTVLAGSASEVDPFVRQRVIDQQEALLASAGNISSMTGEGGDLQDIVASESSVPLRVAGLVPESMDAMGESPIYDDAYVSRLYKLAQNSLEEYQIPRELKGHGRMRDPRTGKMVNKSDLRKQIDNENLRKIKTKLESSLTSGFDPDLTRIQDLMRPPRVRPTIMIETPVRSEEVSRAMEARAGGLTEEQQQILRQMRE